jgi:hypothetical protein
MPDCLIACLVACLLGCDDVQEESGMDVVNDVDESRCHHLMSCAVLCCTVMCCAVLC